MNAELEASAKVDQVRDAKGWLSQRVHRGKYHEVTDQPALTAVFDMAVAKQRSRSFRKLTEECALAFMP